MLPLLLVSSLAALLFVYLFMPSLWLAIISGDDCLDAHEAGLALVASRNPFRESGPPVNMAKLVMLRHKIQATNNRKRKNVMHVRQISRSYNLPPSRPKTSWIRFGKSAGSQYH